MQQNQQCAVVDAQGMSDTEKRLLAALKRRWITSLEAAQTLGVWALSQRCGEFRRAGVPVIDKWVRTATGKRVKAYRVLRPTSWTA